MFKGYYTLTSGMLSQNRNLNVISNNITNASTPGFKSSKYLSSTFQEQLMSRLGTKDKLGTEFETDTSMIRASQETVINYEQGGYDETDAVLDFALSSNGFFNIQTEDGVMYTRNGSFIIDDEGYLSLPHYGRVLGTDGNPIYLNTDYISSNNRGEIYTQNGEYVSTLAVTDFQDYNQLMKVGEGLFQSNQQGVPINNAVVWKTLERSNVNVIEEMTSMLTSQRAIQSSAQVLKIYDTIMGKASTEIGRV